MNKSLYFPLLLASSWNRLSYCWICTSQRCDKIIKLDMSRQHKIMTKLLHRAQLHKKAPPAPNINTLAKTEGNGEDGRSSRRRVSVLNKLFMRHVTDMMTTGEIADMVKGRQLEISQVKVAPNFTVVYVLWLSRGDPDRDIQTEAILLKVGALLRHNLSQLKVIGVVPRIQFVKDTQFAKVMEVERALANADFGDDFEPSAASSKLKTELILNTKLEPDIIEKIKMLERENEEMIEEPMPPMRQDVLGLDRNKMLNKLENVIRRAPLERTIAEGEEFEYESPRDQKLLFSRYLREKERERKKMIGNTNKMVLRTPEAVFELERKKYIIDDDYFAEDYLQERDQCTNELENSDNINNRQ